MAEGFFRKIPAQQRKHYQRLLLAVAISLLLHTLLLSLPFPVAQTPPQTHPVINAELRLPDVTARTLSDDAATQATQQPQATTGSPGESAAGSANPVTSTQQRSAHTPPLQQPARPSARQSAEQRDQQQKRTSDPSQEHKAGSQPMQPLPEQPAPQRRQTGLVTEKEALSADPLERSYQQRLLAHLRERVIAPASFRGSVRLELTLSYRQIATSVRVIRSSGDQAMDDWAIKSALAANPYPRVPDELPASYTFRPTIRTQP